MMIFYLALGAAFAIGGRFSLKSRGSWPFLATTLATVILGLGTGLWYDHRINDPDSGFTILLFLLAPTVTGGVIFALGKKHPQHDSASLIGTIFAAIVFWALSYVLAGMIGILLGLVTF